MGFEHPILLLVLVVVPFVVAGWWLLERHRAARAAAWSSPALMPNMVSGNPGRRRFVPLALFLVGLTLLLAGFARPTATLSEPREGATVVLALDVSGSMAATDVKPTRLAAATGAIRQFLKDIPAKYRVSLVTFAATTAVKVVPVYDRQLILEALPTKAEVSGSALGDGALAAAKVGAKAVGKSTPGAPHPPAAVLLLSDGERNEGTLSAAQAAAEARKLGVPISTVALGTQNGVVNQKVAGGFNKQSAVPAVPTQLKQMAQGSGGRFFAARSADELKQVYKDLGHRLAHEDKKREITQWWTLGALGFIALGAVLSGLWFRRLV